MKTGQLRGTNIQRHIDWRSNRGITALLSVLIWKEGKFEYSKIFTCIEPIHSATTYTTGCNVRIRSLMKIDDLVYRFSR